MVKEGSLDKSKRMSADQIQERLEVLYPLRYDIPSSRHIEQSINSIMQSLKRKEKGVSSGIVRAERYFIPTKYAEILEQLLLADSSLMPAAAKKKLLDVMNIAVSPKPGDWPPEEKIRQKVSSLKSKLKKQNG